MSELDQIAPGGVINLSNAPAGLDDATFDSLFPADGTNTTVAPAQQGTQPVQQQTNAPVTQPTTAQSQDFFLRGDKSVYKTAEEALKGVNEKDTLIENLRQRYALTTGIDPITGQPIQAANVQQPQEPDYYQNPELYLDSLYKASKESPAAYRDAQAKFVMDTLKPLQPLVQKMAREQAMSTVATEIQGIEKFVGSPDYVKALDSNPELKGAIATAETDSRFYGRLGGLYKLAHSVSQGMRVPDLLRAQAQSAQPITPATPAPVRTTVQPSTTGVATQTAKPTLGSIEGIKAIIANAEANGAKLSF